MAAQRINVLTAVFSDPAVTDADDEKVTFDDDDEVPRNLTFTYPIRSNIQTLSSKGVEQGSQPYGFLYVPDLSSDDCREAEEQHVPQNATRINNIPSESDFDLTAFAPWFSPECMLEYFEAARDPRVKAFLVYQPGHTNAMPPVLNDASWNLNDGGSWQSANTFPTYALSSMTGSIISQQLALYSQNVSDVPHGGELTDYLASTDYVRLFAMVVTDPGNQIPSLWVFLVIVLGLLIFAIVGTSVGMHFVQNRRRTSLRRRVVHGEVDLEALGVKRLTVPRECLEKLPSYPYSAEPKNIEKMNANTSAQGHDLTASKVDVEMGQKSAPLSRRTSAPTAPTSSNNAAASTSLSQPTCAICLDDFQPNESQVRELPCGHIYDLDCIDPFLLNNSSLCPICKKTVLPAGYCPRVTNVMVRRERIIRRMRARNASHAQAHGSQSLALPPPLNRPPRALGSLGSRIGGAMAGRRIFSAPERTQGRMPDVEMANTSPSSAAIPGSSSAAPTSPTAPSAPASAQSNGASECVEPQSQNRREWARQRAMALLGNRQIPEAGEDEEENTSGPKWRRALRKVFPGFR